MDKKRKPIKGKGSPAERLIAAARRSFSIEAVAKMMLKEYERILKKWEEGRKKT